MSRISNEQINKLSGMADELEKNFDDMDKSLEITCDMCRVLGIEPITFELFEEMMNSDEPLVF